LLDVMMIDIPELDDDDDFVMPPLTHHQRAMASASTTGNGKESTDDKRRMSSTAAITGAPPPTAGSIAGSPRSNIGSPPGTAAAKRSLVCMALLIRSHNYYCSPTDSLAIWLNNK
jgi:hypothetical protein